MPRQTKTATIPAGQSLSNAIDCRDGAPILVYMPEELTPARLSFALSPDNVTYFDVFDQNAKEVAINVEPDTVLRMDFELMNSALGGYLKIRTGSREHPIKQEQDREFIILIDTGV